MNRAVSQWRGALVLVVTFASGCLDDSASREVGETDDVMEQNFDDELELDSQPPLDERVFESRLPNADLAVGLYLDKDGCRLGFLFPDDEMRAGWTDKARPGGTNIEFFAEGNVNMKYWLGHERKEVIERLCVFAKTGAEGSTAAFWIDDEGRQSIVHLGSGSGSILACVLADDPVDFLRLIAIGYDEICWDEEFDGTPKEAVSTRGALDLSPNVPFQRWVRETFAVTIPETAREIVKHPAQIGDKGSPDRFNRWLDRVGR